MTEQLSLAGKHATKWQQNSYDQSAEGVIVNFFVINDGIYVLLLCNDGSFKTVATEKLHLINDKDAKPIEVSK